MPLAGYSRGMDERITLSEADIVSLDVDAVVNAANAALSGGGGVDGAIHRASGPRLLKACRRLGRCEPGGAVITPGFSLKARKVIHAVGPVWSGGGQGEEELLRSVYRAALELASQHGCRSVAFPAISCGAYRYPVDAGARVAVGEVRDWLASNALPESVVFCCFDSKTLRAYQAALGLPLGQLG